MGLPNIESAPAEQQKRLNAFLAELAPAVPTGIQLEPSWEPQASAWTIWVVDAGESRSSEYGRFVELGHDLADKHGLEMSLIPVEVKHWD
jgi:hypothetical protein